MGSPCLSCGACCAHFRVSFYWSEAESFLGGRVPIALTAPLGRHRLAMAGTDCAAPRCVALHGTVGDTLRCSIYDDRPSPCRDFVPSWQDGRPNPRCDEARAAYGLAPLPDPCSPPSCEPPHRRPRLPQTA
ncbi:MAG: YkgJ family cysteine cluster protein [Gammaproteobacteria bacterium]